MFSSTIKNNCTQQPIRFEKFISVRYVEQIKMWAITGKYTNKY